MNARDGVGEKREGEANKVNWTLQTRMCKDGSCGRGECVFREWGRISRASQVINMPAGPTPLLARAQSAYTLNKLIHLLPCLPYYRKCHHHSCAAFCLQTCVKSFGLMPRHRPHFPRQTIMFREMSSGCWPEFNLTRKRFKIFVSVRHGGDAATLYRHI